jgi:arsenate reductase
MITIYHNPRCTKSREGLCEIENLNKSFTIRKYLDEPFTKNELKEVIKKLNIKPLELTDEEIIDALLLHPKLIERPIVVIGNKAIIARPKEKINELLQQF